LVLFSTNSGTWISYPVSSVAGLGTA